MPISDIGLEELSEAECRSLLAAGSLGRVAITVGALPAILPVNYALLDGDIVFRTGEGSKLRAALERAVVAFEIDAVDAVGRTGWSVLVVGHATGLWRATDIEQAEALGLQPWAPGPRDRFVRLTTGMISGRRIVA
jgi:nitroimidazol reductase NimA-like FMN-containing flavoprotein (pyridoxamine 5'-phosphate oxidase superfamily)